GRRARWTVRDGSWLLLAGGRGGSGLGAGVGRARTWVAGAQGCVRRRGRPGPCRHGGDGAVHGCGYGVFHLHGLDHRQGGSCGDVLPDLDGYVEDRAGHGAAHGAVGGGLVRTERGGDGLLAQAPGGAVEPQPPVGGIGIVCADVGDRGVVIGDGEPGAVGGTVGTKGLWFLFGPPHQVVTGLAVATDPDDGGLVPGDPQPPGGPGGSTHPPTVGYGEAVGVGAG